MQKVLILVTAASDENSTEQGQALLREFHVSFELRVVSAQLAPDHLKDIVTTFQKEGGRVILCLAVAHDPLAAWVAAFCPLPVLHVAASPTGVPFEPWAGPLPVAFLGFGAVGFKQAAFFVLEVLALHDPELLQDLRRHRHSLAARMIAADQQHRVNFDV